MSCCFVARHGCSARSMTVFLFHGTSEWMHRFVPSSVHVLSCNSGPMIGFGAVRFSVRRASRMCHWTYHWFWCIPRGHLFDVLLPGTVAGNSGPMIGFGAVRLRCCEARWSNVSLDLSLALVHTSRAPFRCFPARDGGGPFWTYDWFWCGSFSL